MTPEKRQVVLVGLLLVMLLACSAWSTRRMLRSRHAAETAAADLAECELLSAGIAELRTRDTIASANVDSATQERALAQQIDTAAREAGLSGPWLQGLDHKAARRVGSSPYLRKPAVLLIRGVTMDQLVTFLHRLTYDSDLAAHDLVLRTPAGTDPGERWDADVTLTYLIYLPPATERGTD